MTETAEKLKLQLSQLSAQDRAELAHFLIHSLDEDADDDVEAAWNTEIAKRLEDIHNGALGIPYIPTNKPTDFSAVYQEVIDFLIKRPTPEEIINFKVSSQAQTRLQMLLEKNRLKTLSQMELAELDVYEQLEHMMSLLKARAYLESNK
jgi:hypothetical protein